MRYLLMMLLTLGLAAPVFAQEDKPKEDEKADATEESDEDKAAEKPKERQMTEAGKTLFEDCERCYGKYYEIVFDKIKENEPYKAEEVWAEAIKEAKNAKYKDSDEFHKALEAMQKKDRVFKKKLRELMSEKAKKLAADVEKWTKEQDEE